MAALLVLAAATALQAAWLDPAWSSRKKITLNPSLVDGAQTGFPVLVSLTADAALAARAQDDGDDLVFTLADGATRLPHEIESFNGTTGALVAWVKVPILSATIGAPTEVFLYYGHATAGSQQNATAVWDAGYEAVWHLGPGLADSTAAANQGTDSGGSTVVGGAVGSARGFDGVDDYVYTSNARGAAYTDLTMEAWIRTSAATGVPILSWEGPDQTGTANMSWDAGLYVGTDADLYAHVDGPGGLLPAARAVGTYSDGAWHYVVGVNDPAAGLIRVYVDGIPAGTDATEPLFGSTHYWRIGSYKNEWEPAGADGYYAGQIGEVRISTVVRSPSWIRTEYNNMANQGVGSGKFIVALGPEESTAGACGLTSLQTVQRGTATLAAGSTTATVSSPAFTAVDPARAFLVFGVEESGADPNETQVAGQLVAGGAQLEFRRDPGPPVPATAVTIRWQVAEFTSGVLVQRGTTSLDNITQADATLPIAVDLAKSFPLVTYRINGTVHNLDDFVRAKLTGTSTLNLSVYPGTSTTNNATVEWQVVQHDCARVQSGDLTFLNTDLARPATIPTPVDPGKSWLVYSYNAANGNGANVGQKLVRGRLTSATTLDFDRDNTYAVAGDNLNLTWYVVEFTDGTLVQRGSQAFAAASTQQDVAITAADPSRSIAVGGAMARGGKSPYSANDVPGVSWFGFELTSTTNLRIRRLPGGLAGADVGWFVVSFAGAGEDYDWRKPVTIDRTMLGPSCTTPLLGFPVLVSLTDPDLRTLANGGRVRSASGHDVVFRTASGLPLDHEVETYLPATGQLVAWVRLPSLSPFADTTIYVHYGNAAVTLPTENPAGVWDTSFRAVYHLDQVPTGAAGDTLDSTANANHGQTVNMEAGDAVGGRIGPGLLFDGGGSSELVEVPDSLSLDVTGDFTLSAWVRPDSIAPSPSFFGVVSKSGGGANAYGAFVDRSPFVPTARVDTVTLPATANPGPVAGTWYHYAVVFDDAANQLRFYWNGAALGSVVTTAATPPVNASTLQIGAEGWDDYWLGMLDEVRVQGVARSACWIETESRNQSAPGTYVTPGTEVTTSPDVVVDDHPVGQEENRFGNGGPITDAELFAFRITSAAAADRTADRVVMALAAPVGLVDGDFTGLALYVDANGNGAIDGGETTVGGAGAVDLALGTLTFGADFTVAAGAATSFVVRGTVNNVVAGDAVTMSLPAAGVVLLSGSVGEPAQGRCGTRPTPPAPSWPPRPPSPSPTSPPRRASTPGRARKAGSPGATSTATPASTSSSTRTRAPPPTRASSCRGRRRATARAPSPT
jgi:hypothetical protein